MDTVAVAQFGVAQWRWDRFVVDSGSETVWSGTVAVGQGGGRSGIGTG